ncbi:MAG: hypothetical protein IID14_08055, partial [Candidatus Marinimicrobia bacterium]|nr:hypothetical protein [Candidatus Neomarinimicrobiota bacterium]
MFKRPAPRFAIVAIIFLWVIWALLPTLEYRGLSDQEKEQRRTEGTLAALERKIINLGLDLQGGIHLVLEVDIPTLVRNLAENKDPRLEEVLSQTAAEVLTTDADFFDALDRNVQAYNLRLIRYFSTYGSKTPDIIAALRLEADDAVNRALEIIRNRVDEFGVSEPTIQKSGRRRIIVELAGIKNPERARDLIQNTALLEFNLVQDVAVTQDVIIKIDELLRAAGDPSDVTLIDASPDS